MRLWLLLQRIRSSAQTYLSVFMCIRKLSGNVQRQPDLYDDWDGGK